MAEKTLKLTLEYDGARFRGWARQPGERTVEGVFRETLDGVYPGWSQLAVAGRTDTGVHATGQVASVRVVGGPPPTRAAKALNAELPDDIAVVEAAEAAADFNARFSATSRAYRYRILRRGVRSPFEERRALWWPKRLDRTALDAAAALLPGTHDFTAFTPTETKHRLFERTVLAAAWEEHGDELQFTIEAVSFVRHMCRILVGSMLEGPRPRAAARRPSAQRSGQDRSAVGALPGARRVLSPLGTIGPMRFPVVLFDFDGTVIDSGSIIIASMRHATKTVLGRDIPDEELGRAVGGSGLNEQMRLLDPDRVDELVACYREHNEPLHAELAECAGMTDVLTELKEEGRKLGVVTAKRRETVKLAFSYLPLEHLFDVVVSSDDTERHKPDPQPLQHALERLGADTRRRGLRRRLAVRHPGGEGRRHALDRGHVGSDPPTRAPGGRGAGCGRRDGGGAPCRPLTLRRKRAAELQGAPAPPQPPLPRARRSGGHGRRVRPALRRAEGAGGGASRARDRRLADAARGRRRRRTSSRRSSTWRRWARSRR